MGGKIELSFSLHTILGRGSVGLQGRQGAVGFD